jgi:hypothetical protein
MVVRELESYSRSELIARADAIGVENAKVLTRTELVDEIVRLSVTDPLERRIARGLLGVARDLVARVVERGLHLPDAAAVIRGSRTKPPTSDERPPIATVTLAEIYAHQGHRSRALGVLDEVLVNEPDHAAARALRDRVASSAPDEPSPETPAPAPAPDVDAAVESAEAAPVQSAEAAPVESASSPSETLPSGDDRSFASDDAPSPTLRPVSAPAPSDGPVGMLDDAPLPPLYDVDEVVLMPVDPSTVFIYWEVRRATLALAQGEAPEGKLVLRILAVTASVEGPRLTMRDVDLPGLVGDWVVRDMPVGAVMRAAVGWRRGPSFAPVSVAMELTGPPNAPAAIAAHTIVRFAPEGTAEEPNEDGALALALARGLTAPSRIARAEGLSWHLLGSSSLVDGQ